MDHSPFPNVIHELNYKLSVAQESNLLSKKECEHLTVREYNTPTIYVIPKIHKSLQDPPGIPIISAIKGPLEKMGQYLDALLKVMVTKLPSFVQDTRHVLMHINSLHISSDAILAIIDVETRITLLWGHKMSFSLSYFSLLYPIISFNLQGQTTDKSMVR